MFHGGDRKVAPLREKSFGRDMLGTLMDKVLVMWVQP